MSRARVPHAQQHQALVLGKRYTCEEALATGMINEVCSMEQLRDRAITAGKRLAGKDGLNPITLSGVKKDLYRDTYVTLMEPVRMFSKL